MTDTPNALVEAVARAIKEATNERLKKILGFVPYPTIDDVPEWLREAMYAEARAAIAAVLDAMETPTFAMITSGHVHCRKSPEFSVDSADRCWRAMLAQFRKEALT